ncbi:hypothetical protein V1478_015284 [Vespula squamosa]|uniref:Uncharacterized protein n=1 Tax=Vespula squamosa TaxID=30214 RepID=A0ABD2A4Q5_VESSQ
MRVEGSPRSSAICTPASTFGCVKSGHCNAPWDLLESYYIKVTSVQSGSPTGLKVWNGKDLFTFLFYLILLSIRVKPLILPTAGATTATAKATAAATAAAAVKATAATAAAAVKATAATAAAAAATAANLAVTN